MRWLAHDQDGRVQVAEELVSTLAHDLNNHLTSLHILLYRLLRRAGQEKRVADAGDSAMAVRVADRLQAIVADLLDAARVREGLLSISHERVDLVGLIRECVMPFDISDHPIVIVAPSAGVTVVGDARRLRQALENLLANAIKHSPVGAAIEVKVETERRVPSRHACISVTDHGPGIAPELLPHIFDRFVKGSESTGLGLGLYLAREIGRAHGGDLSVRSAQGAGTCFTLTLPLRSACARGVDLRSRADLTLPPE
jgi:signal transduction histidine kinase